MISAGRDSGGGVGSLDQRAVDVATPVSSRLDVSEHVALLSGEALCIAVGVTGLMGVNESFSRGAGDTVIAEIGRRLVAVSPPNTIVARVSGDRFVVVMPVPENSRYTVADIATSVREPIETTLGHAAVGCALGVTTGPSRPPLALLDRADRNLTAALGRGSGTIEWRDQVPAAAPPPRARLGAPLLAGLANEMISAHFQPVVDLATGRIVEYESFARWQDDRGCHHDAAQFIDVAKDTGVIGAIGTRVLQSALELSVRLCERQGLGNARVSVNVSAAELSDHGFAQRVTSMLTAASIPPEMLQFEITDGIAPLQADYVAVNLSRLRDCGVRFALDGFGSRSANLLNLRDLDIDVIKLDPAMSRDALDGSRSMNVLRSILSLAGQLGIEVIAKGIETVQQHELLLQIGCRYGQGYLYSPPRAMGELDLGGEFDVHPPGTAPDEAHRRALIRSIAATGAPDAADIAALVRSVAQRNGADMGVMAMVEDGVRWASWEMSSRCDPEPPEIEALVRAVCATGPMAINDMIGRGYVQSPSNGCGVAVRSLTAVPVTTSDGSAIGALCLLWLDPMRPGCQDTDDLALSADHIASRIELAFLRSHLATAGR